VAVSVSVRRSDVVACTPHAFASAGVSVAVGQPDAVAHAPHAFASEGGVSGGMPAGRDRTHPPLICEREGVAVAVWRGWGGHALSHTRSASKKGGDKRKNVRKVEK